MLQLFKAEPQMKRENTREEGRGEAGIYLHCSDATVLRESHYSVPPCTLNKILQNFLTTKGTNPEIGICLTQRREMELSCSRAMPQQTWQTSEIRAVQLSLIPAAPVQSDNLTGVTGLS